MERCILRDALAQASCGLVHGATPISVQECQTQTASDSGWGALVAALPLDPAPDALLSHAALVATIVGVYEMRVTEMAAAAPGERGALESDGVFDALSAFFSRQACGDGEAVFLPELTRADGPIARVLMSCRCAHIDCPSVRVRHAP